MLSTPFYKGQGLGNMLANYVTVRCLALDKGLKFGVQYPENFKGKHFMNLDMGEPVIGGYSSVEGQEPEVLPDGIEHWYKETTSDYDPRLSTIQDNTLVHGGLQGTSYFHHRQNEVREWLKVEPMGMRENLCVINFRGGEYKYVPEFFLPQSYWDNAIAEMLKTRPDMIFEVHTDDPEEAKKFFPNYPIISDIEINWTAIRYARYLILSNSSFAILPAYLNQHAKRVIAPWGMGRFNTGEWLLKQNFVRGWDWLDRQGVIHYEMGN